MKMVMQQVYWIDMNVLRVFLFVVCLWPTMWQSSCTNVLAGQLGQLAEAKRQWNGYLRAFPSVDGRYLETITYFDGRPATTIQVEFICDFPNVYFTSKSSTGFSAHIEANKKYEFSLADPSLINGMSEIENCFLLGHIPTIDIWTFPANARRVDRNSSVNLIAEMVAPGLLLSHKWLPVLVENPDFVFESLLEGIQDGERVVQIKFSNNPKVLNDEAILMNVRHGEVTLLPNHYWLIKEGTCFFESDEYPYTIRWQYEYDFESFAVPVLLSRHLETFGENGQRRLRRDILHEYKHFENVSRKKFALSDYGFPEPDFGERRASPVLYALTIIGMLMVVYALWRLYRKRNGG